MLDNIIFEKYLDKIEKIFNKTTKYAFLVGAGISLNPPSNLKTAKEIVKEIVKYCAPEEEVETILNLDKLRYESIIEYIQLIYDEDLSFMDYFEYFSEPNLMHYFLSNLIKKKHHVITTNFDYLIENALKRILTEEELSKIRLIITKQDYLNCIEPNILSQEGYLLFTKIHGFGKNFFTQEDTKDSLITTISALGKGRAKGETFAIEPFKRNTINNIMAERSLVVIGYSGSDDFDIGPTLEELSNLTNIIWIKSMDQYSKFDIL